MRPPEYQNPIDPLAARAFIVRLAVIVLLLIASFQSISFYVESLWFDSLGFEAVFWYRLRAQALVFLVFGAASALILWVLFRAVMPPGGPVHRPFVEIAGETITVTLP